MMGGGMPVSNLASYSNNFVEHLLTEILCSSLDSIKKDKLEATQARVDRLRQNISGELSP